jgi:hypothetical protein
MDDDDEPRFDEASDVAGSTSESESDDSSVDRAIASHQHSDTERLMSVSVWAGQLFMWNCLNCTRPNRVVPPSTEMLDFSALFIARLAAWRKLLAAKRAYANDMARFNSNGVVDPVGSAATLERPVRPDFEGMEATLPAVPFPPAVPSALLNTQVRQCRMSGAHGRFQYSVHGLFHIPGVRRLWGAPHEPQRQRKHTHRARACSCGYRCRA